MVCVALGRYENSHHQEVFRKIRVHALEWMNSRRPYSLLLLTLASLMVYHYGTFVFKPGVDQATIDRCFAEMRGMVGKIPGLLSMQHGVYQSDEGLNDGFTHGFVMTFDSPQSRDDYLPHPEHERVKLVVVPNLARVMVFDFTV